MQSQGDEINLRILFQSINSIIFFVYQIQRPNHFDSMFEKSLTFRNSIRQTLKHEARPCCSIVGLKYWSFNVIKTTV